MSKSINRDPMAVFMLSNTKNKGNTKIENKKKEKKEKKKGKREKKRAGRTPMLQKWSMSIKPFGGIHTE